MARVSKIALEMLRLENLAWRRGNAGPIRQMSSRSFLKNSSRSVKTIATIRKLNGLGDDFRNEYLNALRDVAKDAELFNRALKEEVTGVSLLRFVSDKSVVGQYRRMTAGGARLTPYSFSYSPPPWGRGNEPPTFTFKFFRSRLLRQMFTS